MTLQAERDVFVCSHACMTTQVHALKAELSTMQEEMHAQLQERTAWSNKLPLLQQQHCELHIVCYTLQCGMVEMHTNFTSQDLMNMVAYHLVQNTVYESQGALHTANIQLHATNATTSVLREEFAAVHEEPVAVRIYVCIHVFICVHVCSDIYVCMCIYIYGYI